MKVRIKQPSYDRFRKRDYPDIGELADAIVKQDDNALEVYRQKCLEIKRKFPKERTK